MSANGNNGDVFNGRINGSGSACKLVSVSQADHWETFIRLCAEMGHGEIERLKIQDGLPVMAELTRKKVKFGP